MRRTAAVVGAILLALIAWQLVLPRAFLVGSNSVGFRGIVATVERGRTLCVEGLDVPSGTGGVRFALVPHQPVTAIRARVESGGEQRLARVALAASPGVRVDVDAHFAELLGHGEEATPGRACLTPLNGAINVGGMGGLQGDQVPARLDGHPVGNRVSLWFLPPEGERRSLLAAAGAVFARAARFRPEIAGALTYPLLLLVVLPGASLAAFALLARVAAGRRSRVPAAVVVGALAFVNAAAWAVVTPAFNGPDEGDHTAYAQHVAQTGRQLQDGAPAYSTELTMALDGVRTYSQVGLPDARPPWLEADERRWRERASGDPPRADGGGPTIATAPNTPLYYALLAPAYHATAAGSAYDRLFAMRLVSAFLGAIVAVCAFGILRELLPHQPLAAAGAGLLVAFQPMVTFMAGSVNNDNGVNAAAALALYLTIRGLRRGLTRRLMLALGATLAVVPLMKTTGLAIYPPVALGLVGMAWRNRGRRYLPAWLSFVGAIALVGGGWAVLIGGGGGAAAGSGSSLANIELAFELPKQYMLYLWQYFLPRLWFMNDLFPQAWPAYDVYIKGGWAAFGWLTVRFPEWVYVTIVVASLVVVALAFAAVVRERVSAVQRGFELAVLALAPASVIVAVTAALFAPGGRPVPAEQGRYAFTAIAALAAIAVGGTFGLGRRWHAPLLTVLVLATVGLCYASRLLTMHQLFA